VANFRQWEVAQYLDESPLETFLLGTITAFKLARNDITKCDDISSKKADLQRQSVMSILILFLNHTEQFGAPHWWRCGNPGSTNRGFDTPIGAGNRQPVMHQFPGNRERIAKMNSMLYIAKHISKLPATGEGLY
jgi:hypothetical protein